MSSRSYKWWVVAMLWFVCFLNYADRQAIFSVFEPIKAEMGLSDAQLGIVGASFMWVYATAAPLAGLVGDSFRRKTLILGGLIFWSLITIATAFSKSYAQLVICRALEGFGEAFYFPASMALVSDYHGHETRSRALAIHQSSVYAGSIAGGSLAGFMADHFGWRSSFYVFGWFGVALGLVLLLLLREPRRGQAESPAVTPESHAGRNLKEPRPLAAVAEILKTPMVRVLMLVFVGANFVAAIYLSWLPTYLKRHFQMSLTMAGVSASVYWQVASMLGAVSSGIIADRLRRRYAGGRMMTQAIGLFVGVPFIFLTGWTLSMPVLVAAMIGFGYFKGMYDGNIWASLHDVVRPERRATAVGLMNSVAWLGGGAGTWLIGVAAPIFGMSACLSANALVYLGVGLLLTFGMRAYLQRSAAERLTAV